MGFFSSSLPSVSVIETETKLQSKDAVLIDVRSPGEFTSGHARGAKNCPLPTLDTCIDKLKGFNEVYVICQSGGRSSAAVTALRAANIPALNVTGGTSAWSANGLPMAVGV